MVLDFEEDFFMSELKRLKPKKIMVQLPEGIKVKAIEMQEKIESLGIEVIFSGETAWGGCSLSLEEAKKFNVDLILHFGHAPFIHVDFPIIYVEVKDILDLIPILTKSLKNLKQFKKLGLSFSIQHRHDLKNIIEFYNKNGKEILLSEKKGFSAYEGHVVGCEYNGLKQIQNDVEAFIVIGNRFHSVGAALSVTKPVYLIDVYNDEVSEMSSFRDKIVKERFISINKLKEAKNVGIIVELKPGQQFGSSKGLIKKFKDKGKNVILISMNELSHDKIMNFYNIDAFVELACPRIAIDDFSKYEKPILTLKEAMCAIDEIKWEDLLEKGFW
jgi:2-(3-amino-3-carboxypropyl)histidine synthase